MRWSKTPSGPQSPHLEPASPSPTQVGVHRSPEGGALNIRHSQMLLLSEAHRQTDSAKGQGVNDLGFPSQLSQLELLSAAWGAADDTYTQGHGHIPVKPCLQNKHWVDLI